MLVSYKWLQDFLDLTVEPHDLAEKITRSGIEIASTVHPEQGMKKVVVGHILSCEPVEGTHLNKTLVDVGEENPHQIVCGAPNVAAGQDVVVALPGARIAGNVKIGKSKLRGIESDGMICGLQELGFSDAVVPKEYVDGIYVFNDPDLKPGMDALAALGMDDYILDFDITPNRADTSSMEGAAWEVGAITGQKPTIEPISLSEGGPEWTSDLQVSVDEKLAPKYYLRKITDVKISQSPLWLQTRLWNAGIRPINNIVDATNYAMLLTGQPLHAYDAATFNKGQLEVRLAKPGEKLQLLNDKDIELTSQDIVITDGEKPVTLAGVMGGKNSEVTDNTTEVLLESAVFDAALVRKSALRHDNRSDSSARFEKGVNWDNVQKALDLAALIMRNHGDATINNGEIKASDKQRATVKITTTYYRINKVLGTNLASDEINSIFDRLGFTVEAADQQLTVTVPNRRWDIFIDADLIEEVGRIYGYDNLPSTQPVLFETSGGYDEEETKVRHLRNLVEAQGLTETINYSLTSELKATLFKLDKKPIVSVNWPLNSSRTSLRETLLSGLLDTVAYNFSRKQTDLQLFEQGRVFDQENGQYHEYEHLAAVYTGTVAQDNWQHLNEAVDFYYVKGHLEALFSQVGLDQAKIDFRAETVPGMHATRTAAIYVNDQYVGFIGQVGSLTSRQIFDKSFKNRDVYAYELNLTKLLPLITKGTKAQPAPKYPAIERDLSILVDKDISNDQIEAVIKANAGQYLYQIQVIDEYEGIQIGSDKRSLAYKLTFLNLKDTLTDEVVTSAMASIQSALTDKLSAQIR